MRKKMISLNFKEFQTPILTASSPEGARDFLIPSRLHKGKFYALPQAPQQFKQLLMISCFDRYFQIAPCFRDEDPRADRSPGEFYQLDIEMSFVTQEEIFAVTEDVIYDTFSHFSRKNINNTPFPRIKYEDAISLYGTDKPDLRNPIKLCDVTDIFIDSDFKMFSDAIKQGMVVKAIPALGASDKSRAFFDDMIAFALKNTPAKGLAYIAFDEIKAKGPIAKFLTQEKLELIRERAHLNIGDAVFFVCDKKDIVNKIASPVRDKLGYELKLINNEDFNFCWIFDFPMYEMNDEEKKIDFSHNPFSMPQGGLKALNDAKSIDDILNIKAYQYDLVCNGIELSSGAIRNHDPKTMYKAFDIAGYDSEFVNKNFGGMIKALKYGAPPHGGIAPGVDRIVMLLLNEDNIRETILFPLNQKAEDKMLNAPSFVNPKQLRELGLRIIE
jgi:aspartyl-tRNA synthetase